MNDELNHLDQLRNLDSRQDEVLEQLNELNARVVSLLKQFTRKPQTVKKTAVEVK